MVQILESKFLLLFENDDFVFMLSELKIQK